MIRVLTVLCLLLSVTGAVFGFTQEEQLSIDGRKVFVKISGRSQSNPYAFFLHYGPGGNAYYFEQTISKDIEKYVTVVTIDFYGAGRSPHSDSMAVHTKKGLESFTTDRYVKDIFYVAEYIGASQFGIIGHDYGAFIGLHCAEKSPEKISWFVAVNPQWDYPRNIRYLTQQLREQFIQTQKTASDSTAALMIDKIQRIERLLKDGITEPERIESLYGLFRYGKNLYFSDETKLHKHPVTKKLIKHELFQTTTGQMGFIGNAYKDKYFLKDALPLLRNLNGKRVLCIMSETMFVDPSQYERIRLEYPSCMFMEISEGHFFPMIEKKKEFTTILQDFLKYEKGAK